MKNGYEWTMRYLAWDLDAFLDANLKADVDFAQLKGVKPHEVRRVRVPPGGGVHFPRLQAYLKVNDILEGRGAARNRSKGVAKADAEKAANTDGGDAA